MRENPAQGLPVRERECKREENSWGSAGSDSLNLLPDRRVHGNALGHVLSSGFEHSFAGIANTVNALRRELEMLNNQVGKLPGSLERAERRWIECQKDL